MHLASLPVVAESLGDEGDAPLLQVAQVRLNSRRKRTHRPAQRRRNAHDARDAEVGQDLLVMAADRRQPSGGSQLLHLLPPQPVSARRAYVVPRTAGARPVVGSRLVRGRRHCCLRPCSRRASCSGWPRPQLPGTGAVSGMSERRPASSIAPSRVSRCNWQAADGATGWSATTTADGSDGFSVHNARFRFSWLCAGQRVAARSRRAVHPVR